MPTVGSTRKVLSALVKGYSKFEGDSGVSYHFARVDVEGSGDVDNIGIPLIWSETDSAFIEFTINADWVASATYALGAIVKPIAQNGYEYICTKAGDADATEPTWPTTTGALETETAGVVWLCRAAYSGNGVDSPLPNGANICVSVGAFEGVGFNETDTTLSATSVEMHVMFRGIGAVADAGFVWGSIAEVDQNEFYVQLEKQGLAIVTAGTTVDPTYTAV